MKYLSLIAVLVILQLSWWFFSQDRELTHSQQTKLLQTIEAYMTKVVTEKNSKIHDIKFSNLYTESVTPGKTLKAHFKFSYIEPDEAGKESQVFRRGQFLVTSNDGQQWKAQIDEISDVKVEFLEAHEIGPNANTSAPAPSVDTENSGEETSAAPSPESSEDTH